jgi:MFS family permease
MAPLTAALRASVLIPRRLAAWLHPGALPRGARRPYALELTSTFFFALALAVIESGVVTVFAKQTFAGVVSERPLNFAVAVLGTMDALANILSFVWSAAAHGRAKVPFINALQVAVLIAVGSMALLPRTPAGLLLLVGAVLAARTCWSGIITIRPTVWRANYPPGERARIVGRVSFVQVLTIALAGAALGRLLDRSLDLYRLAVPAAVVLAIVAVWATRQVRVRRQGRLLRHEREGTAGEAVMPPWMGPVVVWRVLRADRWYAKFMLWMFVLGFGNLMVPPMLAIALRDQFGMKYLDSILIASTIPYVVQSVAIPLWAGLLDRAHVVHFRAFHAWSFVVVGAVYVLGTALHRVELMYAAAGLQGVASAGGTIAWNLGHVDFSPPSQTSRYMATHVTLNGVRGLIAPIAAVMLYEALRVSSPHAPAWVFAASLGVSAVGAAGFVSLRLAMGRAGRAGKTRLEH